MPKNNETQKVMKKVILTGIVLTGLIFSVKAQVPDVKFGAKGGVNFSHIRNSSMDARTGFHLGVLAEIFINEQLSFQPEALYSTQGGSFDSESMNSKLNLDYISVPLMFKYYAVDGFNLQVGPQFSFLTKAKYKVANLGSMDVEDSIESPDFSLNFGLGYEFPFGVFLDARYNHSLTKISKNGIPEVNDGKADVVQLSAGYKF